MPPVREPPELYTEHSPAIYLPARLRNRLRHELFEDSKGQLAGHAFATAPARASLHPDPLRCFVYAAGHETDVWTQTPCIGRAGADEGRSSTEG